MKKWILNLGLTTLAVLPIVAIASCSSTTNEIPTLTTEVAKYKNPFTVKEASKTMTPEAVVASINKGSNTEKINTLQNLVVLQLDNTNFTYTVGTATVGTNNVVDVSIKISEKADASKSETVKLVISGFAKPAESLLDKEVKRFTVSVAANEASKTQKSVAVVAKITEATGDAKLTELQKLTTVPEATSGFNIKVLTAKVGTPDTSVEVTIEVSETGTDNKANATFTVTGFATLTPSEILTAQAERLVSQPVLEAKKGETPSQAKNAITKENLNDYYKAITLSEGITYAFASAEINATTNTTLDVTLTVSSNVQGVDAITKKVEITGFTSPQALLQAQADLIVNQTVVEGKATETAKQAAPAITDTTKLKTYYNEIALATGFSYELKTDSVSAIGDTVQVTVTVTSSEAGTTPVDKTFTISGFKKEVEVEAEKITTAQAKNQNGTTRQIIAGINDAASQEDKLTALKAIVDLPQLAQGFKIEVGDATVNPTTDTSVNVALTVIQEGTDNTAPATFIITGLTAETVEAEITRLVAANLVDKVVLTDKANETAAQAGEAITDLTTLAPYYTLIPLPKSLKYNFVSKVADGDTVKVTISISLQDGATPQQKEVVISGFKTLLEVEADKLTDEISLKRDITAAVAQPQAWNNTSLLTFYSQKQLSDGYTYNNENIVKVDKTTPTTLNVTLTVYKTSAPTIKLFKTVKISGFQEPTEFETKVQSLAVSLPANDATKPRPVNTIVNEIRGMSNNQARLNKLKTYVADFPNTTGLSFTDINGKAAITIRENPEMPTTSVIVQFIVSATPVAGVTSPAPVYAQFTITGLGTTAS